MFQAAGCDPTFRHLLLAVGLGVLGFVEAPAAERLGSLDAKHVRLGGEIGRRIEITIRNNVMKIDNQAVFLKSFRNKDRGNFSYVGLGKHLDALARLAYHTRDEKLIELKNHLIGELIKTQLPSGYIGVFPEDHMNVWWDLHETSYLVFGLVSDYNYFGNQASLRAAERLADYMMKTRPARPINVHVSTIGFERAFIALYEATGRKRYLDHVTVDNGLQNWQAGIGGHAYDYLSVCMAQLDLYRHQPDLRLLRQSKRVIDFMLRDDGMLVMGTGSNHEGWHNDQTSSHKFSETCFTAYWLRLLERLLRIEGNPLYGDVMERTIYNALFAAQSPQGRELRKYTPFEGRREYYQGEPSSDFQRDAYCCPNNFRRIISELPAMIYYRCGNGLTVSLYTQSEVTTELAGGVRLRVRQETDYPSSGKVVVRLDPSRSARFPLRLRIPRWCRAAKILLNGRIVVCSAKGGRFFTIDRRWKSGDRVELDMPMNTRLLRGRKAQAGRVAVMRGPLLFCLNPARQDKRYSVFATRPGREPAKQNDESKKKKKKKKKTAGRSNVGPAPGEIKLDLTMLEGPVPDDAVRPGGLAYLLGAWSPGRNRPQPPDLRLILTEYADPGGEVTYFPIADPNLGVKDELLLTKTCKQRRMPCKRCGASAAARFLELVREQLGDCPDFPQGKWACPRLVFPSPLSSRAGTEDGFYWGSKNPGRVECRKKVAVESAEVDLPAGVFREGRNRKGARSHQFGFAGAPAAVDLLQPITPVGLTNQIRTTRIPSAVCVAAIRSVLPAPLNPALHAHDVHGASAGGIYQRHHLAVGCDDAARDFGSPAFCQQRANSQFYRRLVAPVRIDADDSVGVGEQN